MIWFSDILVARTGVIECGLRFGVRVGARARDTAPTLVVTIVLRFSVCLETHLAMRLEVDDNGIESAMIFCLGMILLCLCWTI